MRRQMLSGLVVYLSIRRQESEGLLSMMLSRKLLHTYHNMERFATKYELLRQEMPRLMPCCPGVGCHARTVRAISTSPICSASTGRLTGKTRRLLGQRRSVFIGAGRQRFTTTSP